MGAFLDLDTKKVRVLETDELVVSRAFLRLLHEEILQVQGKLGGETGFCHRCGCKSQGDLR